MKNVEFRHKKPLPTTMVVAVVLMVATVVTPAAMAGETTNVLEIVTKSIDWNCLKWRPVGMCQWLCINDFPPYPYIGVSVKIAHRNPELVVGTWHAKGRAPWRLLDVVVPKTIWAQDGGKATGDGSAENDDTFGDSAAAGIINQSTSLKFKNVAVVSSPVASVRNFASNPAIREALTINMVYTCSEVKIKDGREKAPENQWKTITQTICGWQVGRQVTRAKQALVNHLTETSFGHLLLPNIPWVPAQPGRVAQAMLRWVSCDSAAGSPLPYFSSAVDLAWRNPELDILMSLNPTYMFKKVGPGAFPSLFPRSGFVKTPNDYKAGFATARRALDLVLTTTPHMLHVARRLQPGSRTGWWPPALNDPWVYQGLTPGYHGCRSLPDRAEGSTPNPLTDVYSDRISPGGRYSWQIWRQYKCCAKPGANCWLLFHFG